MKNEAISAERQPLTVDLRLHQVGGQIVGGMGPAGLGQLRAVLGEIQDRLDDLVVAGRHLVVTRAEDHRRPVEDLGLVLFGDAHHVADDLQRKRTRERLDEVRPPVGVVGHHVAHQPLRPGVDAFLDAGHHLRGERPVDDRAQPQVPRVVEADHRAAELRDRGSDLAQRHAGRDRTEDLRMPARIVHVIERRQRPVPWSRLESLAGRALRRT